MKYTEILLLFVFVLVGTIQSQLITTTLYVSQQQQPNNTVPCGLDITTPCPSILMAIESFNQIVANNTSNQLLSIQMANSMYPNINNTNLDIKNMNITINGNGSTLNLNTNQFIISYGNQDTTGQVQTITLNNFTILNGWAGNNGSVIYFNNNNNLLDVTLNNVMFSQNAAGNSGGVVYINSNSNLNNINNNGLTILGCTFNSSNAFEASAIYVNGDANVIIQNTLFNLNNADFSSVIYIGTNSTVDITYSTFQQNLIYSGSLITISSGDISNEYRSSITNCTFIENGSHSKSVSAIEVTNQSSLTLEQSSFYNNSATVFVFVNNGSYGLIDKVDCSNNSGGAFGSCIRSSGNSLFHVTNSVFNNNYNSQGGVINCNGAIGNIFDSSFTSNTVLTGPGVLDLNICMMNLTNIQISDTFSIDPGTIYCDKTTLYANNVTGSENEYSGDHKSSPLLSCTSDCHVKSSDLSCSTPSNDSSGDKEKKKLSNGKIAGIIFGCFIGVGILSCLGYILFKRRQNSLKYTPIH